MKSNQCIYQCRSPFGIHRTGPCKPCMEKADRLMDEQYELYQEAKAYRAFRLSEATDREWQDHLDQVCHVVPVLVRTNDCLVSESGKDHMRNLCTKCNAIVDKSIEIVEYEFDENDDDIYLGVCEKCSTKDKDLSEATDRERKDHLGHACPVVKPPL